MSQQVTINGKKFEPSAALAREFGYSMDYISRLAREGKVEATRVGRQWFVEALSLKNFVEEISKQKEITREQIRTERKLELMVSNQVATNRKSIVDNSKAVTVEADYNPNIFRNYFNIFSAATGTALILLAGVLSSVLINPNDFYSFYASLDFDNFSNNFSLKNSSDVTAGALAPWIKLTETKTVTVKEKEDSHAPTSGVVLFEERQSDTELERVRNSFSDEVEINFEGEDTGVITPIFKKHRGDEYQFLMVPVSDAS